MSTTFRIILISLCLFCGTVCDATIPSTEEIAVRIALPRQTVCVGTNSLPLELYITNVGARKISISPEWLVEAKEYSVVFDMREGFARIDSLQTRSDPISEMNFAKDTPITLLVGSAKHYEIKADFNNEFFQKPGFYKMRVHYRGAIRKRTGKFVEVQIPSNWLIFEVEPC